MDKLDDVADKLNLNIYKKVYERVVSTHSENFPTIPIADMETRRKMVNAQLKSKSHQYLLQL